MKIAYLLPFFLLALVTSTSVYGQENALVPEGSTSKISDWALSGVIWSDASLVKKLATQAAREANSSEQVAQFSKLFQQSSRIVEAMESFGWKQVKSTTNMDDNDATTTTGSEKSLPNPEDVGAALAKSMNLSAADAENYRVDDYIDETPAEVRDRADAIEDGVEGAIAAASGRLGTGTESAEHFGYRESQTLSGTLPYARGSIYRNDNPLGTNSNNRESVDSAEELRTAMAREERATRESAMSSRSGSRTDMNRYTTEHSKYSQDANWVQFHLDANQLVWTKFTTRENLNRRLSDSLMQLRADVSVALEATSNERLKSILMKVQ